MVQSFASYIIMNQDYTFRCFLLEFRHFKDFAYDHWPRGEWGNGFSLTFLYI